MPSGGSSQLPHRTRLRPVTRWSRRGSLTRSEGTMIARRMALTAWLAIVIAGCTGGSALTAEPAASQAVLEVEGSEPATASSASEATPEPTPERTPKATPLPVPAKPTGVAFREHIGRETDGGYATISQRVTWKAPRTTGVEIRVYGVTKCLAEPDPAPTGPACGPCLVKGTKLPALRPHAAGNSPRVRRRRPVALDRADRLQRFRPRVRQRRPGDLRHRACGLQRLGQSSTFAIAEPGGWYIAAEDEVIC